MGVTRQELFSLVGLNHPELDAVTEDAYKSLEAERLKDPYPRTGFIASKFPGDDLGCGRQALYSLANPPMVTGTDPRGIAIMGMGEAAEAQIVWRWGKAGLLIAGVLPDREGFPIKQFKIEDPEYWISGKLDAVLDIRPSWPAVLPVDIKSKADGVINDMRNGFKTWDPSHRAQVMIYTHYCRALHDTLWGNTGLVPALGGMLYYVSRDNPRNTVEYYFPYDEEFCLKGLDQLKQWKQMFLDGDLPSRPKEWRWTEPPCKWCDYKKQCKEDIRKDVDRLDESHVLEVAMKKDKQHLIKMTDVVNNRWKGEQGVKHANHH